MGRGGDKEAGLSRSDKEGSAQRWTDIGAEHQEPLRLTASQEQRWSHVIIKLCGPETPKCQSLGVASDL